MPRPSGHDAASQRDLEAQFRHVRKRRRATRACDFCHQRAIKCRPGPAAESTSTTNSRSQSCSTCIEYGVPCTQLRPEHRRGTKPSRPQLNLSLASCEPTPRRSIDAHLHGSKLIIRSLIDVYFDTIYPIYPFFDQPNFLEQWHHGLIGRDQASYANLMALCALSAQHVHDKAVFTISLAPAADSLDPATYLHEALHAIPAELDRCRDLDYLRAFHLLALYAIQVGNTGLLHKNMGMCHALLAQDGLQDEKRWPSGLSDSEREVRRRLFWSIYRLEVHTSLVLGHIIRIQESQCAVLYPTVPDNDGRGDTNEADEWLTGWNLITDLYRILEYAVNAFRAKRTSIAYQRSPAFATLSAAQVLEQVHALQTDLPVRFRQASCQSQNVRNNRCGFQTANIVATVQLVKMTIFSAETATIRKACEVALELIENVSAIPLEYFRAISSPMFQELSGIGHILSSVIGKQLSEGDYQHLRLVILSMAGLLTRLSSCYASAGEAGARLRQHVDRIDQHITEQQEKAQMREYRVQSEHNDVSNNLTMEDVVTVPSDLFDYMLRIPGLSTLNPSDFLF